ncbi:MAG: tRNA (N6-threonylcarbamoyladenosine(37)-N6)-methyltransferase TrmO [Verrucomicrobiota bacterium]
MSEGFVLKPIGWMRSPWKGKFGVPRQPGLVKSAKGEVEFAPEFAGEEAREGLEGFSHLWVTFVFDRVGEEETRLRVRPPRLGGNERRGVFATRSPFRPNRLGLSLCEIEAVNPVLRLGGVDLVDGTPILDLRPYLPYVESVADALGGFADEEPQRVEVRVREGVREAWEDLGHEEREVIREMLGWDPRPAYVKDEEREFGVRVGDWEVKWCFCAGASEIVGIVRAVEKKSAEFD